MTDRTAPASPGTLATDPAVGRSRRLPDARIGLVPILWNNVDLVDLAPSTPAETFLDETVRLGFEGVQFGRGFPEGDALRDALAVRGLALAELYAEIPCTPDGPTDDAPAIVHERLALLHAAGGEVLVPACQVGGGRETWAGRGEDPGAPQLTDAGWRRLGALVDELARDAADLGHLTAFHPHSGTFVETPAEVERFAAATDPTLVAFCLDVGHYTVGGGDPVAAIERFGKRVRHAHLKDVDGGVLAQLRSGSIADFDAAIRARLFTELGHGSIDVTAIVDALERTGYTGWLMSEQDSTWLDPTEAAAASRRTLEAVLGGVA